MISQERGVLRTVTGGRNVSVDLNSGTSMYRLSCSFALATSVLGHSAVASAQSAPSAATPTTARNVALVNGQWFDGRAFAARTVYSVNGRFSSRKPARVDTTVDLSGTWVVPPFGEAHNHNVDGVVEGRTRAALARYIADGVFYVQIQGNFPVSDSLRRRLPMNRPEGPDVALAQAFVTASGGHPIQLHESVLLPQGYYPGFTRERLRDSLYVTLDSEADLERKWPQIRALHPDFIKAILWGSDEYPRRRDDSTYFGRKGLDPQLLPKLVARAHRDQLRVSVHINNAADFHYAVAAGVDEIAHGGSPSFFNTIENRAADPAALRNPAALQQALLEALRAPAGNGRGYVPIAEVDAREAARRGIAVATTVALLTRAPEPARAPLRPYVAENLKRLRDAGVTLVVGSDNPMDTSVLELEQLAALGVWDNLGLLKLWSEATPRAIYPGRRIGALADGYEASFLALGGNPLADISSMRQIRLRFKQGVLLGP
jgi:imidazolonepropionase-like amidohydrolase